MKCPNCGTEIKENFCPECGMPRPSPAMDLQMLVKTPVQDAHLRTAAFVDVETTGLSRNDEIIELAVVLFRFEPATGRIIDYVEKYSGLREPRCPIHPEAAKVHHIKPKMLKGKTLDDDKVLDMFSRAEFIIAHNAGFDRRYVCDLYPVLARKVWACSLYDIDWRGHGFAKRSLAYLTKFHRIPGGKHRALNDAESAVSLLATKGPHGRTYFSELLKTSQALSEAARREESQKLTDDESLAFETIKSIVDDTRIGYNKTKSYISIGFGDGQYWFARLKWGPRAKHITLRNTPSSPNPKRIDLTTADDLQKHVWDIAVAYRKSLNWYGADPGYEEEPTQRALVDGPTAKSEPAHKSPKSCLGCLGMIALIVFLLSLLGHLLTP